MNEKLGILGGMGPQATISLYQKIVNNTRAFSDQEHIPTLIDNATSIPDRTNAILSGDEESCYQHILESAKHLECSGCTALVIPCHTAHYFVPRLQAEISIPIINMIDETVNYAQALGYTQMLILGTNGTIQAHLYQDALAKLGIESRVLQPPTQQKLMDLIYRQIKQGIVRQSSIFSSIDIDVCKAKSMGVILACTELSVYNDSFHLPAYYLDPLNIVARKCIQICNYPLQCL